MGRDTHFDAVVVGSGFGGSVSAYRLAQAGQRVCVLERGKAYPPESFARRPREMAANFWDPSRGHHGLFNIWSFRDIEAVVASGLGGGSLIYANVLIRKDEKWFVTEDPFDGGYEHWPLTRDDLEPHYDQVEQMLGAQRYPLAHPGFDTTAKTLALRKAAEGLGLDWQLPNLAVTFANENAPPRIGEPIRPGPYPNIHGPHVVRSTCRLTGECDLGCNYGSKNTLDHNYLSAAKHFGADIRTRCEVRRFEPLSAGGFSVSYVEHDPDREGVRTKTARLPTATVTADRLILAAGTLGTTYLLLRNRSAFPGIGSALGTRFSGNGDFLGLLLRSRTNPADGGPAPGGGHGGPAPGGQHGGPAPGGGHGGPAPGGQHGGPAPGGGHGGSVPRVIDPSRGPVITSFVRLPDGHDAGGAGRGGYIEDAGFPVFVDWMLETTSVPNTAMRFLRFGLRRLWAVVSRSSESDLSGEIANLIGKTELSAGSLPLLGMGRDVPDGVMGLRKDHLDVKWNMATSQAFFDRLRQVMIDVGDQLGATYHDNPLKTLKRLITVHPLGGCPMGRDQYEGVVDAWGEVFNHPGLYVADGAAMPGSVGANPSLTIAACANRMADRILEAGPAAPRPAAPTTPEVVSPDVTSLEFTEEMKGYVTLGESDYRRGYETGKKDDNHLMFHLTIEADDVERFVADRNHLGSARGWVQCDRLGGRLEVERGLFNLFLDSDDPSRTWMRYRLLVNDPAGSPLTLSGFKNVKDDPGFDLWPDTSTLYTRVLRGHVTDDEPEAEVLAAGILRIHLADFAKQLTTFRVRGASLAARAKATAAFGGLFLGKLWDVYGSVAQEGTGEAGAAGEEPEPPPGVRADRPSG